VIDPDRDLTAREHETLTLITKGCSNDDIALAMFVSSSTVRSHVAHLFQKMHVHNRAAAAVAGIRLGLITTMDTTY
jgi:DNA-binding NarL/FixJ family response regulator